MLMLLTVIEALNEPPTSQPPSTATPRGASVPSPPKPFAHTGFPVAPPGSAASGGSGVVGTAFFTIGAGSTGFDSVGFASSFFPEQATSMTNVNQRDDGRM